MTQANFQPHEVLILNLNTQQQFRTPQQIALNPWMLPSTDCHAMLAICHERCMRPIGPCFYWVRAHKSKHRFFAVHESQLLRADDAE